MAITLEVGHLWGSLQGCDVINRVGLRLVGGRAYEHDLPCLMQMIGKP